MIVVPIRLGYLCLGAASFFSSVVHGMKLAPAQVDEVHQLNAENFGSQASRGLWMVEHYSPGCQFYVPCIAVFEKRSYEAVRCSDNQVGIVELSLQHTKSSL